LSLPPSPDILWNCPTHLKERHRIVIEEGLPQPESQAEAEITWTERERCWLEFYRYLVATGRIERDDT
jgi:hypothetical protein